MSEWTTEELSKIETAEELNIASMQRDGTLRKPVTIWVVRHGDQIYVRSVGGPTAGGFVAPRRAIGAIFELVVWLRT